MKRSQLILLGVFLVISGLIYFALSSNKKEYAPENKKGVSYTYVPIQDVMNRQESVRLTSYGQVTPNTELMIAFEIQGKLKKGDVTMKPGANFRKGQTLYRVDDRDAYYSYKARKEGLAAVIVGVLADIELDFPSERNKWIDFINGLRNEVKLPDFPKTASAKEAKFFISRSVYTEYYTLKGLESQLEKYWYQAPFSGTVINVFSEPGSIVNPGVQIAKISKTSGYEVKVPIGMNDIDKFKEKSTVTFSDPEGNEVATGKITRVSNVINQQTQSADVYYSIQAVKGQKLYSGMFLNISMEKSESKKVATLPRTALDNDQVMILKGEKLVSQTVVIVDSSTKPDSIMVTGLRDGQQVVLEKLIQLEKGAKYKGIKR